MDTVVMAGGFALRQDRNAFRIDALKAPGKLSDLAEDNVALLFLILVHLIYF